MFARPKPSEPRISAMANRICLRVAVPSCLPSMLIILVIPAESLAARGAASSNNIFCAGVASMVLAMSSISCWYLRNLANSVSIILSRFTFSGLVQFLENLCSSSNFGSSHLSQPCARSSLNFGLPNNIQPRRPASVSLTPLSIPKLAWAVGVLNSTTRVASLSTWVNWTRVKEIAATRNKIMMPNPAPNFVASLKLENIPTLLVATRVPPLNIFMG